MEHILRAFEERSALLSVFLDLSKAFDCVKHENLIEKLQYLGICNNELNLIVSYLSNREQCVVLHGRVSDTKYVKYGVPQGSVLGPLLFLVAVNDLACNLNFNTIMYADDTTLFAVCKDYQRLDYVIKEMTQEAKEWFNANGFVLNESKTESITFKIKAEESQNFKMLGVYLDSKLSWAKHIDYVCNKLSRVLYMLRHLKLIVPYNYLRVAYFAYFQSIMKYGLIIWGNSAHTTRVFKLQKKAIRILSDSASTEHCRPLFIKMKLLTLTSLYIKDLLYIKDNINKYDIRSDFHLYTCLH